MTIKQLYFRTLVAMGRAKNPGLLAKYTALAQELRTAILSGTININDSLDEEIDNVLEEMKR